MEEKDKAKEEKCRGRPLSFDRDSVIDTAMNLFWEKGYKNSSFNEIAKECCLTRASLYNAFESKESILIEALEKYAELSPVAQLSAADSKSVSTLLLDMFCEISSLCASDINHKGCMIVNCMNELMAEKNDLGEYLTQTYNNQRKAIEKLIDQAIEQGELPPDSNSEMISNILLSFLNGFALLTKTGASDEKLCAVSKGFLETLGFSYD